MLWYGYSGDSLKAFAYDVRHRRARESAVRFAYERQGKG